MDENWEFLGDMVAALHQERARHKVEEPELVEYDDRDLAALNSGIEAIKQLAALKAENAKLRDALGFYADEADKVASKVADDEVHGRIVDLAYSARKALEADA